MVEGQLLAQKTASLWETEGRTPKCTQRPAGLPECLQVINQASKQLNKIPFLLPGKPTFLRTVGFEFSVLIFLGSRRECPVASFRWGGEGTQLYLYQLSLSQAGRAYMGAVHSQEWVGTAV